MAALPVPQRQTTPRYISVAGYLATRLQQLGVDHLFGLPGDYNLALIDALLAASTLEWVGCAHELNAGYAADGYARVRGLGAVVTTFGVGELSAINAIAGSYAESVPVVQITGSPPSAVMLEGALLHHSLADGDFQHFVRAYRETTAEAEVLTPATAHAQIDRALAAALDLMQPVYLSIPADVVDAQVPSAALGSALPRRRSDSAALASFTRALSARIGASPDITMLAGNLLERRALQPAIRRLADTGRVLLASLTGSKGILDENHPAALGPYIGALTPSGLTRRRVEESPALVLAGAVLSDLVTGLFSHRIDPDTAIVLEAHCARLDGITYDGVELADSISALLNLAEAAPAPTIPRPRPTRERDTATDLPPVPSATPATPAPQDDDVLPITQAQLWTELEHWIRPGTCVLADSGTAYYGAAGMRLAPGCTLQGQPTWSSIGYTLPALLGVQVADPRRPALLVIGDGAAQLTFQELATIMHRALSPVIVLLNNAGYTIERAIRSPDAVYHDITSWDWTKLATALGDPKRILTMTASTPGQLREALDCAEHERHDGRRAVFIEVILGRNDTPPLLAALAGGLGRTIA
jgi:TPP-dependent 2-oxoacid decarboxylase